MAHIDMTQDVTDRADSRTVAERSVHLSGLVMMGDAG